MSRNSHTHICAGPLHNLFCQLIRYRRILIICQFIFIFLLGQSSIFLGDRTLCYCQDRESFFRFVSLLNRFADFINIIRNLRDQHDICTACNTCMKCQPSYFMSHNFHNKYTTVRSCCGMDTVNTVRCDINCTLESKGHVGTPDIIIDGLGEMDDIESLFTQKIGCLLCSITAQDHQTIQIQSAVVLLHGCYPVQSVFIRYAHIFKRLTRASKDRTSTGQDS